MNAGWSTVRALLIASAVLFVLNIVGVVACVVWH
jgi:hypothetical protein